MVVFVSHESHRFLFVSFTERTCICRAKNNQRGHSPIILGILIHSHSPDNVCAFNNFERRPARRLRSSAFKLQKPQASDTLAVCFSAASSSSGCLHKERLFMLQLTESEGSIVPSISTDDGLIHPNFYSNSTGLSFISEK